MKNLFFLFGFLVLLVVLSLVSSASSTPVPTKQVSQNTLATKTDSRGEVTVEATPKNIQEDVFEFEIVMDTHSVALDQDMAAVSKLIDDRGSEYKPTLWKGDGPGGHHRSGILRFERIAQKPKSIKLIIGSIGGAERNFSWDL
ncbi:MAG: hypothetical protein A3C30_01715 [Candidatus Levybacteria bacterium RIFCSPHIGHO2_02_FULL_40_18]|nr:MAG: hypothetical protein A2869_01280 [Candidatus Levybacteria bacterium RIFCSPHIGHO2_01_FULL_40_58]OGH26710.1 MAG: hypothetical protein A3C30_01715 [Candidatus Levybacteria bacterium RIFCSPHIGHO2_02_FULL_40_18]OGH31645.1 MAG: hypothetical protein A3E43_01435 [Candidatus Levybacteria bacterium RIFCSPHIGHO2_12_FULL_40_31]OGH40273.1 MAG: hypothetical protein A2894_02450 [Candidatus Levybacteria bacterium RIFCSPLOWO2_01_FULL_40_64]OGH48721.1 MAG: hypothetical protein A3I54_03610 [Candidatus Lev